MSLFAIIIQLTSAAVATAALANDEVCSLKFQLQSLLSRAPEPLPRNPLAKTRAGEKTAFGWMLEGEQKFPDLKRGDYVYLIDSEGRIFWGPRVPDLTSADAKLLVTHRALDHAFKVVLKQEPAIVAAGEFYLEEGRVVHTLNNKARTFMGKEANLTFAEERLRLAGLDFRPDTRRQDWSSGFRFKNNHEKEIDEAKAMKRLRKSPKISRLVDRLWAYRAEVAKRYPGKVAGTAEWADYMTAPVNKLKRPVYPKVPSAEEDFVVWVLSDFMETHDSINFQLLRALETHGEQWFERMIEVIPQMEGYLYR